MIGIIVAVPAKHGPTLASLSGGVIGKDGGLPRRHKGDLKRFAEVTRDSAVIMGRRTWESIGKKPLPDRDNIIVTSTPWPKFFHDNVGTAGVSCASTFAGARHAASHSVYPDTWIIGGAGAYLAALDTADIIDVTFVPDEGITGDAFFPPFDTSRWVAGPVMAHPYNPALLVCAFGRAGR